MMKSIKYLKAEDMVEPSAEMPGDQELDLSSLIGTWVNTNSASQGINKIVLDLSGKKLMVRMFGATDSTPRDWGSVEADCVYAAGITSAQATAFSATYRFDSKQAHLLTNLSLGLLIVAICTTVGVARHAVSFSREFYRRDIAD